MRATHYADLNGIGTVRYRRLIPKDAASAKTLQTRTLTNLDNERPTWLALADKSVDAAVAASQFRSKNVRLGSSFLSPNGARCDSPRR